VAKGRLKMGFRRPVGDEYDSQVI
jgi:hypothetical protein